MGTWEEHLAAGSRFSPRELDILKLLAQGKDIKEISDELYLDDDDEGTIRTHISNIVDKLEFLIWRQTERVERIERNRELRRQRRIAKAAPPEA